MTQVSNISPAVIAFGEDMEQNFTEYFLASVGFRNRRRVPFPPHGVPVAAAPPQVIRP